MQYGSQLVLLLLIVFFLKKHHKPYWQKWDLAQVFNPALNRRFIILAAPMVVQYAMQVRTILPHNRSCCCARARFELSGIRANRSTHRCFLAAQNWAWGILQGIMSSKCEILATAYGVWPAAAPFRPPCCGPLPSASPASVHL